MSSSFTNQYEQYDEDVLIRDRKQMLEDHTARMLSGVQQERERKANLSDLNPENTLDGKDSNSVCMCRKEIVSSTGPGYVHFACCEDYPGQCKWRMSREPSKDCMFMAQTRIKVSGHSVLVSSCTRVEAQEDASRLLAEEEARLAWEQPTQHRL